jgi:hypothetical protein
MCPPLCFSLGHVVRIEMLKVLLLLLASTFVASAATGNGIITAWVKLKSSWLGGELRFSCGDDQWKFQRSAMGSVKVNWLAADRNWQEAIITRQADEALTFVKTMSTVQFVKLAIHAAPPNYESLGWASMLQPTDAREQSFQHFVDFANASMTVTNSTPIEVTNSFTKQTLTLPVRSHTLVWRCSLA